MDLTFNYLLEGKSVPEAAMRTGIDLAAAAAAGRAAFEACKPLNIGAIGCGAFAFGASVTTSTFVSLGLDRLIEAQSELPGFNCSGGFPLCHHVGDGVG